MASVFVYKWVIRDSSELTSRVTLNSRVITEVDLPTEFFVELDFKNRIQADMWSYLPWVERRGAATIGADLANMEQVMKFISFGMFYQPKDRPQLA